jgi:hypothetical protein
MTGALNDKRDFFISFNQADRAWATWIAWVLEEAEYSVWFQDWDFRRNFIEHMDEAHRKSAWTIAVLSDNYFGSEFARLELSARMAKEPDRLIPVHVGSLSEDHILDAMLYADLTGCGENDAEQHLLGHVRKWIDPTHRPKPNTRPGFPGSPARQVPQKPRFPVAYMTAASKGKRDFFISFTSADRPWACWIARVLREEGYSFWFQDQDFAGSVPRGIEQASENSTRTILVLSDAYAKAGYCRSEWEMRYQQDPDASQDLILFRVSPCTLSGPLNRIAYLDLFACDEATARDLVRHRLRKAVEPDCKIPPSSAPFPGGARIDIPFPVPSHNLSQPNPGFVGRTAELDTFAEALADIADIGTAITQPQAINGLIRFPYRGFCLRNL